jgi:RNA polymerase sigma-70 factor (ECF subfamily)
VATSAEAHGGKAGRICDRATAKALTALYRDNIDQLRAYLARILKSSADADDVAQDAFLRLCRSPDFSHFLQPRAVLFKTGYRLALNKLRQRRRNPLDRADEVLDDVSCGVAASAEQDLIAREQELAYNHALETLSPRRRQVIELRTVHELSYKQMSDTLGLSVSTLEKHLARGKSDCTAVLAEWWKTDHGGAAPRIAVAA